MTNQNQIPQIEPMPLSELQEAVIAAKDDMESWERICSDFRLMRSKGRIYAIIPTSAVSVDEATDALPQISKSANINHSVIDYDGHYWSFPEFVNALKQKKGIE